MRKEKEVMEDRKFERSVGHGCLLALGSSEMGMSCCGAGGRSTTLPAQLWTYTRVTRGEETSSQKMPPKGCVLDNAVGNFLNQ